MIEAEVLWRPHMGEFGVTVENIGLLTVDQLVETLKYRRQPLG